jgi:DNA-binding transcriptional LysR family regulator
MELRHLRYFDAVATALSFSRAAEHLHIAQPPLSRQIRQLEDELGAVLFDRSARPLQLTPAGRFFHTQVVQTLARLAEASEATRRIAQGGQGWFGIGFVPSTLYGFLPEVIRRFRAAHPQVEVGLSELTTLNQKTALKAGRIDIGFGRLPLDDSALSSEVVARDALVAALPARHRLLASRSLSLARLAEEPLLLYPAQPRPSFADQVLAHFHERGLHPVVAQEANEMQTAIGLVAAGIGITLVPAPVQALQRSDVAYRPLKEQGIDSPVTMNQRAGDQSPLLLAFQALVRETLPPPFTTAISQATPATPAR